MFADTAEDVRRREGEGQRKCEMHCLKEKAIEFSDFLTHFMGAEPLKPVYKNLITRVHQRIFADPINFRKYVFEIVDDLEFVERIQIKCKQ